MYVLVMCQVLLCWRCSHATIKSASPSTVYGIVTRALFLCNYVCLRIKKQSWLTGRKTPGPRDTFSDSLEWRVVYTWRCRRLSLVSKASLWGVLWRTRRESGVSVRDQPCVAWCYLHLQCVGSFFCVEYRGSRLLRHLVIVYHTARCDTLQDNGANMYRRANISVFHFLWRECQRISVLLREYQRISFRLTRILAYFISFYMNIGIFLLVLREYQRISFRFTRISACFISFYANISVFHFVLREYQRILFSFTRILAYLILFYANIGVSHSFTGISTCFILFYANISLFHFVLREYQRISFCFTQISAYFILFYANISVFHFVLREY